MEADNHPQPNTGVIGDGGVPYVLLLHLPEKGLRVRCILLRVGGWCSLDNARPGRLAIPTSCTSFLAVSPAS